MVFNIVLVPWTVKSPPITKFPSMSTLLGKPTLTVFEFSTTSISPAVPWIVSVSPKLTTSSTNSSSLIYMFSQIF